MYSFYLYSLISNLDSFIVLNKNVNYSLEMPDFLEAGRLADAIDEIPLPKRLAPELRSKPNLADDFTSIVSPVIDKLNEQQTGLSYCHS